MKFSAKTGEINKYIEKLKEVEPSAPLSSRESFFQLDEFAENMIELWVRLYSFSKALEEEYQKSYGVRPWFS